MTTGPGRFSVAPVGTPADPDGPWYDLGTMLEPSSPWLDQADTDEAPPGIMSSFDAAATVTLGYDASRIDPDLYALIIGDQPPAATHRLEWVQAVPGDPVPPRKRRGLTGKAYRAARRAYAREHRAWVRAGRPDNHVRYIAPRVRITDVTDAPGSPDTYSVACTLT